MQTLCAAACARNAEQIVLLQRVAAKRAGTDYGPGWASQHQPNSNLNGTGAGFFGV
jgi:hypothetical protein